MTDAARAARTDFHVALAAVLLPVLSVPLTVALALRHRADLKSSDAAAKIWARRLWIVVAADLIWPILLMAALATGSMAKALALRPGLNPKARIGVVPADVARGPVEVRGVVPGRPAERAGVKVGDVIEQVGPMPVDGMSSLLLLLGSAEAGKKLELTVRRAGVVQVVTLVPEEPEPGRPKYKLLEPLPGVSEAGRDVWWAPVLALPLAAFYLWARRRRAGSAALATLLIAAALAASIGGERLAATGLRRLLGGFSLGTFLLGLSASTVSLLAVAALARWLLGRRGLLGGAEEPKPPGATALRAVMYSYALSARISLLLIGGMWLLGRDADPSLTTLPRELASLLDPNGVLLLAVPVVILGPIAEELLFRGVLLPWLRGFSSDSAALWLSSGFFALAHLHYGAHLLAVLPIGLALGWARLRTNGLAAPILAHTAINGLGMLALAAQAGS